MIQNIFEQYDQYNLMIPCHYSILLNDNPKKCRMNFQVTYKTFQINLFKFDTLQKIDIHNDKWKIIRVMVLENIICFIKDDDSIDLVLLFINDSINFKRFLFSLAESGLIVPGVSQNLNENDFLFISKPSFIPTSSYSYSTKLNTLFQIRNVTQSQILYIVEKEVIPFNEEFIDFVLPFAIQETDKQIEEGSKCHPKIWAKMKGNKCGDILEFLISKISIEDYPDEHIKELIHSCQSNTFEKNTDLIKNLNDVDKDKERMVKDPKSQKWSPNLCSICALVCKSHVLKTKIKFVQGQFEVVKRIALLMNGEILLSDDDEDILPDIFKKKFNYNDHAGIEGNLTFFKYLFALYEFMFDSIEKKEYSINIKTYVDKISEDVLNVFKQFLPKVAPFFIVHKIKDLFFYNSCYATIFCDSITNIWPVWIMLKKMHEHEKGYVSLAASILYLSLPTLLEKKVRNEEQLRENNPLFFNLDDKIEEIIKISSYLYRFRI